MEIIIKPIGTIFTPFKSKDGMPIQAKGAKGIKGYIKIKKKYVPGLADLEGFSHIILLYHFHQSMGYDLQTAPFLDNHKKGVFATRAPKRPNPIGLSVVRLLSIETNILHIEYVDMLNNTPLLDIKPYISAFDHFDTEKEGWLENKTDKIHEIKSDKRFMK